MAPQLDNNRIAAITKSVRVITTVKHEVVQEFPNAITCPRGYRGEGDPVLVVPWKKEMAPVAMRLPARKRQTPVMQRQ